MNKIKKVNIKEQLFIIILITSLIFISSCEEKPLAALHKVTIGTFNLSWLGDGINDRNDRTEKDYEQIAEIIKKTGVDVLGVQEVENAPALKRIMKYLPDYSFVLGEEGGAQKVGLIYKKIIRIKSLGEYMPVEVLPRRTKPGLLFEAKAGNFDWEMMVVHLKSSSHFENTEEKQEASQDIRFSQAEKISEWAYNELKKGKEKDLIIVGDFNDSPLRKKNNTLSPILANKSLTFLTSLLKSCKFKSAYVIDQIVVSSSAETRYIRGSERVYDFFSSMTRETSEKISDHCPVTVTFDATTPDNEIR